MCKELSITKSGLCAAKRVISLFLDWIRECSSSLCEAENQMQARQGTLNTQLSKKNQHFSILNTVLSYHGTL
jgi:hypothetical protein